MLGIFTDTGYLPLIYLYYTESSNVFTGPLRDSAAINEKRPLPTGAASFPLAGSRSFSYAAATGLCSDFMLPAVLDQ